MFKPVSPGVEFPKVEEEILSFWKENKIFEKSVEKEAPNGDWTFLDGPPFVTGMPHYGHLLGSIHKDVFGRYYTMKGYRVRRVWGWDGHGLPIENKVEGELEIKRKKDIEDVVGVKKFIEECKKYVEQISGEWEWYVDHIGRWVDFKNAYKTWDTPYMESVMWVFKQMYEGGHIYKGIKVTLFCPHCSTPISNFEVAMDADNYKDVPDHGTTYKYELKDESGVYILAWSTTPWNKIVTPALAVNPKLIYVKVEQNEEFYILAKSTIKVLGDPKTYKIIEEIKGTDLIGKKFTPHYDYYKNKIKNSEKAFEIIGGEFVTAEEGTGVVTIAAYGEEDLKAMNEHKIHIEIHLDEEGNVRDDVPLFGGMYYLKANKAVNQDLAERKLIYKDEEITHSVPLCWRCHTRLYYAPIDAWYVNVQNIKELLKKTNEEVNWYPAHFKKGRFLKSLENAPDWNISRNRYWGSPVPVWECKCGERFVPGSIKELEEASGAKIETLHKPEIDEVLINCKKCGEKVKRVPEVLDSWIEAGSASFGERHYPFDSSEKIESFFPPDFIAEYTGQIRAWFYVLHVIGGAMFGTKAFKNVGVEGVILGTDGRKMSKNLGNYPDPKELLSKYGGDALRLYLMSSPIMNGEDIIISEDQYRQQVKGMLLIVWNTYNFFVSYANSDNWDFTNETSYVGEPTNDLDRYILVELNILIIEVTKLLDDFDTVGALNKIQLFVDDYSKTYIRGSRERVRPYLSSESANDKNSFYSTTYKVLITLVKLVAPIAPFITEEIFLNLNHDKSSVHLEEWPVADDDYIAKNEEIKNQMYHAKNILDAVYSSRKEINVPLSTPMASLATISPVQFSAGTASYVQQQANVTDYVNNYDTSVTESKISDFPNKIDEKGGEANRIVRQIQEERKKIGTSVSDLIDVSISAWPKEYEKKIKDRAMIRNLTKGEFKVTKIS